MLPSTRNHIVLSGRLYTKPATHMTRKGRASGALHPWLSFGWVLSIRHALVFIGWFCTPAPEWGWQRKELATASGAFVAISTWKEILLAAWRYGPGITTVITCTAQPPRTEPGRLIHQPGTWTQNFMELPTSDGEAARARPGGNL